MLGLSIIFVNSWLQAEEGSVKIMIPWNATGSIYHIAIDKLLCMGEIEGVMYLEKAQGELNEEVNPGRFFASMIVAYWNGLNN